MKYLLVLALCFTSAVVVMSKSCNSDDDCDEDECCLSSLFSSRCKNRLDERQSCNLLDRFGQKRHFGMCPCKTGMKCENTRKTIFGIEYDPRCVKSEEPVTEPETKETEPEPKETEPEPETTGPPEEPETAAEE